MDWLHSIDLAGRETVKRGQTLSGVSITRAADMRYVGQEHAVTVELPVELFKNKDNPAGYIVPHPATFVIDKLGRVAWKFTNVDAQIRPMNAQILEALEALPR